MKSIQKELQFGSLLSVSVLMLLLWWLGSNMIQHFGEQVVVSRVEHDGENIIAQLAPETGALHKATINSGLIYQRPFSGHYYSVQINQTPMIRSRSLWDTPLAPPQLNPGESKIWYTQGPMAQPLLVWSRSYQKQQNIITLSVAEDLSPFYVALRNFNYSFAALSILALIILIAVQRLMLHRILAPLQQLKQHIQQLEEGQITTLPKSTVSELQPIVTELNRALELLAERLTRSRNALGNLAHALKAPLNLVMRLSERSKERFPENFSSELRQHAETIHHLIDRELRRARLSGTGIPGRRFDPEAEIPILVRLLQQIYEQKEIHIRYRLPEQQFPQIYDRDDLLELIGNLLDNACKWAKQQVALRIDYHQGNLRIVVSDDGQGCSPQEIEQLTQRGVRIDEGMPGHGLGLSIVCDIVTLYHGNLHISSGTELSGLSVTINLPSNKPSKSTA